MKGFGKKMWCWLAVLALLSPIGVTLPKMFHAGNAWGEWGAETLGMLLGYTPEGLAKIADRWHAPLPDYSFSGYLGRILGEGGSYLASALAGGTLVALFAYVVGRLWAKREK